MRNNYHKRGKTWLLVGIFLFVGVMDAGAIELVGRQIYGNWIPSPGAGGLMRVR